MKVRAWAAVLGIVALAGTGLAGVAIAQGSGGAAAVIAQRREGLKRMGQTMEAMKPVADARGDARAFVPRIEEMIVFYRGLPALFPPGSGTGDTKALPAIWTDWSRFEEANTKVIGQLEVLKAAAASGDGAAFASAFQATGPQYCGSCHRPFRAR
jgi:cytochrome c556